MGIERRVDVKVLVHVPAWKLVFHVLQFQDDKMVLMGMPFEMNRKKEIEKGR